MKPFSLFKHVAALVFLTGCVLAVARIAQTPNASLSATHLFIPCPQNLKVLSKDVAGQQGHDIMEQWERSLGMRCDSCHAEAAEAAVADDDSHLNYADASKPMKAVARTMYKMTEDINSNYSGVR